MTKRKGTGRWRKTYRDITIIKLKIRIPLIKWDLWFKITRPKAFKWANKVLGYGVVGRLFGIRFIEKKG